MTKLHLVTVSMGELEVLKADLYVSVRIISSGFYWVLCDCDASRVMIFLLSLQLLGCQPVKPRSETRLKEQLTHLKEFHFLWFLLGVTWQCKSRLREFSPRTKINCTVRTGSRLFFCNLSVTILNPEYLPKVLTICSFSAKNLSFNI